TSGGVTFILQDRAGRDVKFLADNTERFLAAARRRPELAGLTTTLPASIPQVFVDVDRARVLAQGVSLSDVYSTMQAFMGGALEAAFAESMPPEMGFGYLGMSFQEQQAAQGVSAMTIFGLSLLVVFLILAAQYESWSLPFSVLLTLPVAVLGAFLALWLRAMENDVYAQIGLVMIIGLSAKNAILIVEYAKTDYERGRPLVDATLGGARVRFRPILMTSFAFIMGVIPLAVASGAASAARRILGTTVIGGMLASTVVAILLIPMTFYVVERLAARAAGRSQEPHAPPEAPEHA